MPLIASNPAMIQFNCILDLCAAYKQAWVNVSRIYAGSKNSWRQLCAIDADGQYVRFVKTEGN